MSLTLTHLNNLYKVKLFLYYLHAIGGKKQLQERHNHWKNNYSWGPDFSGNSRCKTPFLLGYIVSKAVEMQVKTPVTESSVIFKWHNTSPADLGIRKSY